MKIQKIHWVAVCAATFILASCSMNKDAQYSNYKSDKLQPGQQLVLTKTKRPEVHGSNIEPVLKDLQNESLIPANGLSAIQIAYHNSHAKTKHKIVSHFNTKIAGVLTADKAASDIARILKPVSRTAENKPLPFEGKNYLVFWIVFLVATAVLFLIAGFFAVASILGLLLTIIAIIALLIFILFLLLWAMQMGKKINK